MALLNFGKNNDDEIAKLQAQIFELENKLGDKQESAVDRSLTQVWFQWSSPSRVFVPRNKEWFLKIAAIFLVGILLLAFLQEIILILVAIALLSLIYVLATIPPENVTHAITSKGVMSFDKTYNWKDIKDFWIAQKQGFKLLYVNTKLKFPARLMLIIRAEDEQKVVETLLTKIPYLELEDKNPGWINSVTDGQYQVNKYRAPVPQPEQPRQPITPQQPSNNLPALGERYPQLQQNPVQPVNNPINSPRV